MQKIFRLFSRFSNGAAVALAPPRGSKVDAIEQQGEISHRQLDAGRARGRSSATAEL
jgi:hypothetical protein